ncbi:Crp/Fnr family transcriptional regulator [Paroceanicella profunda]|uniref:Crp/Fnr family transcriptional regulator n=1 Tax=Paroceanicella profunda TaxID=2579971 RepID=A0A5B8FVT0_9RHOB|nr:Crp/Fnr family transcriptional regulator [Paroceanicella profunda]QDL91270.1 Crp/Fnr family transcriptional regulator [Paroceanicella profunda]
MAEPTGRKLWGLTVRFREGSLLSMLEQPSLDALGMRWRARNYPLGSLMINADDPERDVWFLLTGAAKATVFTENGREVAFLGLAPGDCFGEFSAIDQAPRSSSVVAQTDCIAARISATAFRDLVSERPDFSFALCRILVAKLRGMTERMTDISALTAPQRAAREVLRLARANRLGTSDRARIATPPTQLEIAGYLSTNRETVAREMGRMLKAGLIRREGRSLIVPSITALEEDITLDALNSTGV